jgi:hypothetical protein
VALRGEIGGRERYVSSDDARILSEVSAKLGKTMPGIAIEENPQT